MKKKVTLIIAILLWVYSSVLVHYHMLGLVGTTYETQTGALLMALATSLYIGLCIAFFTALLMMLD